MSDLKHLLESLRPIAAGDDDARIAHLGLEASRLKKNSSTAQPPRRGHSWS
ncbi:MAG: hypothetical protein H7315_10665 [Herminiimonas sp.]|nr:hypothetical protein [Herminiimonas sp.]